MMSVDGNKAKNTAPKKESVTDRKTAEALPKTEGAKTEATKAEGTKAEGTKAEGGKADGVKPDAAPANRGMGEGQKPVSQAYKDNWDAIFAKKKKR